MEYNRKLCYQFFRDLKNIGLNDIVMKEIILVFDKVKPSSRIFISDNKYQSFKLFCDKYGLYVEKGSYRLIADRDIGKGGWGNRAHKTVSTRSKDGALPHYISTDWKTAKTAMNFDSYEDDQNFAEELGFPVCCQNFYSDNYDESNSRQCDFSLITLRETKGDYPYSAYNNYIAQYFGLSLLSHFLCTFNCKKSEMIAKRYYDVLSKYSKNWADKFLKVQRSAILFTEYRGIFLLNKFNYRDGTLIYNSSSLKATLKNSIYSFLKKGNRINIIDKNHFIIMDGEKKLKEFKGKNYGLMIFK